MNRLAVHGVVFDPVVEFLFDPLTDLDVVLGRDSNVSTIEQCMNVLAEKDAVAWRVCAALSGVGFNVCRVQDVQYMIS